MTADELRDLREQILSQRLRVLLIASRYTSDSPVGNDYRRDAAALTKAIRCVAALEKLERIKPRKDGRWRVDVVDDQIYLNDDNFAWTAFKTALEAIEAAPEVKP